MFLLPVPRAIHEGSEVLLAAKPRGGWRTWDHSGSGGDPLAWSQESSHTPNSPAFMARMGNLPLHIRATSLPKEQLTPSLQWEHIPDVTFLLPVPTQTETILNPGCWQTSTTPLSPRAHPAPLHHPDGQLPSADAVALHPTSAHGHVPEAPVCWDVALPVVSQSLWKQWPKGWGHVGTQLGSPFAWGNA